MDAIKFLKTAKRRYISNPDEHFSAIYFDFPDFEVYVKDVEEWAKEHPAKTRQSVFLEQYPEASLTEDGILSLLQFLPSTEMKTVIVCPVSENAVTAAGNSGRRRLSDENKH